MQIGIDGNEANVKNRVGTGEYALELLGQFAKNKSHHFSIYLKEDPIGDLPKETANFKYQVIGPKNFWTQFALPISLTFGKKPDVFFSMAHYGPRFSSVPYVVTIHDLSYLHFPQLFKKNDLYQLTNWSKYSILNSAHVIAPSNSTKDDILKNYHVKSSKVTVTYEGYDKNRFKPQPKAKITQVLKKYKIAGDYLIFVGTLQPRKNIERLIEAFASIAHSSQFIVNSSNNSVNRERSTQNFQLVIVGKLGWLYGSIFAKVKALGITKNVVFTDFVPDADIPGLISGAKVYINPSLWEGFGIPVIEAQACGVPVVASNTSSLPEIVGDSAIQVDPESVQSIAKGIEKVLTSEKTSSDLVKKGLVNAKRFSWQECAQKTLAVLEKTAQKSSN